MAGLDLVPFGGYISDDSDFHGTLKLRKKLKSRSENVNPLQLIREWNKHKVARPTALAALPEVAPQVLYNRLEGHPTARQLSETVDEFLKRLPPKTTFTGDWIWITDPVVKGKGKKAEVARASESEETPDGMRQCNALLEQYSDEQDRIKTANLNCAQSTITRKLGPLREKLKEEILDLAVASRVTNGKWMLFPKPDDVNRVWRIVAEAVIHGRLGDTAKVAPADPPNPFAAGTQRQSSHLICVYTKDFSDLDDVRRVLDELVELGLAPRKASDGAIYYKADVYTYLGLDSNNPYGLKASLYSSKDLMGLSKPSKGKQSTITAAPSTGKSSKRKQQTLTSMLGDSKKRKT